MHQQIQQETELSHNPFSNYLWYKNKNCSFLMSIDPKRVKKHKKKIIHDFNDLNTYDHIYANKLTSLYIF